MDSEAKKAFITKLCDELRDKLTADVPLMPEKWGEAELKQYVADAAAGLAVLRGYQLRSHRDAVSRMSIEKDGARDA